ncbi:hypothetical protein BDZ45DRAFT_737908 [Acephala macrosclerotiorum]|nr:hypothetical protein BDZ45DRAFT_737908 [Acephala macrosclerotiorum]
MPLHGTRNSTNAAHPHTQPPSRPKSATCSPALSHINHSPQTYNPNSSVRLCGWDGPGVAIIPLLRANFHGNVGEKQVGLEGEWALVYKRKDEGEREAEEGIKENVGSKGEERWVRVKGRKGWREWTTGKRERGEVGESEVVVWIDGDEWTVFR